MADIKGDRVLFTDALLDEKFGGSWSRSTLWRRWQAGEFPAPAYMGVRPYWLESQIDEWLKQQVLAAQKANQTTAA